MSSRIPKKTLSDATDALLQLPNRQAEPLNIIPLDRFVLRRQRDEIRRQNATPEQVASRASETFAAIERGGRLVDAIADLTRVERQILDACDAGRLADATLQLSGLVALTKTADVEWRLVVIDSAKLCLAAIDRAWREHLRGSFRPTFDNQDDPA